MSDQPIISVLMPVYNGAKYLAVAIQSVCAQTFRDFEFIAVDDGSTDHSLQILQQCAQADSRLKIVSRPNTGIVGALNDGLAAARGEFVARMDADDIALPTRFEKQLAAMRLDHACVALGSAVLFTDPEGRPLKVYSPTLSHASIEEELARGNGGALIHPTVLFRRDALVRCGGYREQYNYIEDLDLYVRLLDAGRLSNLPDVLLHYRQHPHSVNHRKGSRAVKAAEIIAPLRQRKGLPPLTAEELAQDSPNLQTVADCYRKWALDAAEGGNILSARANALRAVRHNPLQKKNWSCLRYVLGRKIVNQNPEGRA